MGVQKLEPMIISTVEEEEISEVKAKEITEAEVEGILIKEKSIILYHPTKEEMKILLVQLTDEKVEVTTTKVEQILTTSIVESLGIELIVESNNMETLWKAKMLVIILIHNIIYF